MPNCSVVGCGIKKSENRPHTTLHRLPKNDKKRKMWLDTIGMENLTLSILKNRVLIPPDRSISSNTLTEKDLNKTPSTVKCDASDNIEDIKTVRLKDKVRELAEENRALEAKIESSMVELIRLETANGKKQYPIPNKDRPTDVVQQSTTKPKGSDKKKEKASSHTTEGVKTSKKKECSEAKKSAETGTGSGIDIRKLDLRIGKIVDVNQHPDADSLYVEQVDCGEENTRTVVSGLVKHVPMEELRNRMVMILCNLKPVKMRGVTSEAMVMCASSSDKVEVLVPPLTAAPGDLVHCEGFPREPEPVLNPKKKIFEACAPDLMTNNDKVACFKGSPLVVPGKGPIVAPTLKGVNVK